MDNNMFRDLAEPNGDLKRFGDGKYLHKWNNDEFDIDKFNRDFEQYRIKRKKEMKKKMALRLAELNKPKKVVQVYEKPLGNILLDTKDAMFEILDDLLQHKLEIDTFTKNNRLFYIGIVLIFIAVFLYMYTIVIGDNHRSSETYKNKHIHIDHLHKIFNDS